MKVYFYTLGCKVNQYETEAMTELFRAAGYDVSDAPDGSDVIVVNSCTVTANSDQKTRQAVRRFKRNNPSACVVLTGCMPQAFPDRGAELDSADIVTGNKSHTKILELVEQYLLNKSRLIAIDEHKKGDVFINSEINDFSGRTRAFVKIQDGCDRFCSYCIIPFSRGRSRSRSLEDLSKELDGLRKTGFKEVVLVGINFCCYGLDIGHDFCDAIELAASKGFERVRIGSLEFDNISDSAIERLSKIENFCPQFHISLQSGSDETLRRMNRHYTTEEYRDLCQRLRDKIPDTVITTDLMVGFPLESDEDFKQSMAFAREIGFEKIHVFPYSSRPGTKAAEIRPQISGPIKTERAHKMLKAAEELREDFFKRQVGKTVSVLGETYDCHNKIISGYTRNYTPVCFKSNIPLQNETVNVTITGYDISKDTCFGELVSAPAANS